MRPTLIEHLGAYEAFDQTKDIGVGATLDLTEETRLVGGEKSQAIDARQSVGQKLARKVEGPALYQITIDLPFGLLRQSDDLSIAGSMALWIWRVNNGVH